MSILPKLLYLFRALPIRLNKQIITKFQSDINKFIWSDSHPRIAKSTLFKSPKQGGLGLPDIWLYYLAARWSQIAQWRIQNPKIPWVIFEKDAIQPYSISGLLWGNKIPNHTLEKRNLSVAHSYQLWKLHYKKFKMSSTPPIHASFVGDPKFVALHQDINEYSWWINNNLAALKKFIENTSFTSFFNNQIQHPKY